MRFLVDNALPPLMVEALRQSGHDAIHVRELGLATAADITIFEQAERDRRVIVSADTDFGTILALRRSSQPSVILFRGATPRQPHHQASLVLANLDAISASIERGAVVVLEPQRIRIRTLPINPP